MTGLLLLAASMVLAPVTPAPSPAPPLREIGHVHAASAFCSAFERHFNAAAQPIIASDAQVGFIGFTLGNIEPHYAARAGELLLYDDRTHMMHYLGILQGLIPQAQREVDDLRRTASLATDADTVKETTALASQLQKALDKQHQIATDTLGVVQALVDVTIGASSGPRETAIPQTSMPGSYESYSVHTPADARDVRSYLHWQDQLDRIGDAEGSAASKAEIIADRCR